MNIKHDLYNIYKDFFYVGNKVYIKGYLNSYFDKSKNNNIFITVTNISNNPKMCNYPDVKKELFEELQIDMKD